MANSNTVKVWDLPVRIFHWSLVAAALILFRIAYGFGGSKYARFSDFVYSRAAVIGYLKSLFSALPKHCLGHNPAGGWMIIVLLVSLALSIWSGFCCLFGMTLRDTQSHFEMDIGAIPGFAAYEDIAQEGINSAWVVSLAWRM